VQDRQFPGIASKSMYHCDSIIQLSNTDTGFWRVRNCQPIPISMTTHDLNPRHSLVIINVSLLYLQISYRQNMSNPVSYLYFSSSLLVDSGSNMTSDKGSDLFQKSTNSPLTYSSDSGSPSNTAVITLYKNHLYLFPIPCTIFVM